MDELNQIKKEFFAYRNGIVAESLKNAGDPHKYIMGCQLTDIVSITSQHSKSAQLSTELWQCTNYRECRLAASMLYPVDEFGFDMAMNWAQSVESVEVADVLCIKLLKHLDYANSLYNELINSTNELVQYTGYRLLLNLVLSKKIVITEELKSHIQNRAANYSPIVSPVLRSILEES